MNAKREGEGRGAWPIKLARLVVDYPIARAHERRGGHPIHELVREVRHGVIRTLGEELGEDALRSTWRVRASTGRGEAWANVCWFAAMQRGETESARDGRYLAILCDVEGRHFIQAIAWGTAAFRQLHEGEQRDVRALLRARRRGLEDWLCERVDTSRFQVNEDVDLGATTELARDYEASCLVWRSYAVGEDLSSVREDLLTLSRVYMDMIGGKDRAQVTPS